MQEKTAIKLTGVPYRGGAPLVTDLLGGHVQLCMDLLANFIGLANDGKVRVLAVTSASRIKSLPDVPTVAERIVQHSRRPHGSPSWRRPEHRRTS